MDETTLQIAFEELRQEVGSYLGYGRGEAGGERIWTESQRKRIMALLKEGQSSFYYGGENWSFLRPTVTLTLADDANAIALPADFGGPEGPISFSPTSGSGWTTLELGSAAAVIKAEMDSPDVAGPPLRACLEAIRGVSKIHGGRMQIHVFPTADQDYSARLQYYLNPLAVSGERPFGYAGVQHHHTILQACKAAAERGNRIKDGPEQAEFMNKLKASVMMDSRNKTANWGYNTDGSYYDRDVPYRRNPFRGVTVTINGEQPE